MTAIKAYIFRQWWIFRRSWFSEITLSIILPVALYLSIVVVFEQLLIVSPGDFPYPMWVFPGLLFTLITVMIYLSIYTDLSEGGRLIELSESITSTPNSSISIITAATLSVIPSVLLKSVLGGILLSLVIGFIPSIVSLIGLLLYMIILSLLISGIVITISLLTKRHVTHLGVAFIVFLFLFFLSGWIFPLEFMPSSLYSIFRYLPTTKLLEGCRMLLLDDQFTILTWLIPLGIGIVWLLINAVIYSRKVPG
ncbi:MAG: ABC transporter permease [Candidatus Marinimicrobia bacterium]|nr:ABC transporter permease [Candidatus Neomarinimicrobiota bacterium]